ncbi:MAG TPA: hypothetical protein VH583_23100 [Vicinamibacterales bacterium]|jgi:hypothetical protein
MVRHQLLLALAVAAALPTAQAPASSELDELLDKVTDYVAAYTHDFVGVVAEETYRQEVRGRARTDVRGLAVETAPERRELRSDMLLVRAPAGDRWLQFRDVFEVDGKPVRDREERLAKLFLTPSPTAHQQIEDIRTASARYNIGGINRNMNLPVVALSVFETAEFPWFRFSLGKKRNAIVDLEFREERTQTLVRTTNDQPIPSRGRFAVERETGRVLASTLYIEGDKVHAQIDVTYGAEPALAGMLVPHEMREKYSSQNGSVVEGRAVYAKFRRYSVNVDEKVKK